MNLRLQKPETGSHRSAATENRPWFAFTALHCGIGAAPALLAACVSSSPTEPVAYYAPAGPAGEASCITLNHCVIRTDTGKVHLSIGEQSAVMISFADEGGNIEHYFDYLVTVRNLTENMLFFDPSRIDGHDPAVRMAPIARREEELRNLQALSLLSAALGNSANAPALEMLSAQAGQDSEVVETQIREQRLVAQEIVPGGHATGRIAVRSDGQVHDHIEISIPVGSDVHTVRFAKKEHWRKRISEAKMRVDQGLAKVGDGFSFEGRWLLTNDGAAWFCNIRTEGNRLTLCYEETEPRTGMIEGGMVKFDPGPYSKGDEFIIAVDDDTLLYDIGYWIGVFERQ